MGCINCKLLSKLKSFLRSVWPDRNLRSRVAEDGKTDPQPSTKNIELPLEKTETSVSITEKRDMVGPLTTVQNSCAVCEEQCLGNCDDNIRVEEPESRLEFSRVSNDAIVDTPPTDSIRPNSPENEWQSV